MNNQIRFIRPKWDDIHGMFAIIFQCFKRVSCFPPQHKENASEQAIFITDSDGEIIAIIDYYDQPY